MQCFDMLYRGTFRGGNCPLLLTPGLVLPYITSHCSPMEFSAGHYSSQKQCVSPTSFIDQSSDWLSQTTKQRGSLQSPCLQLHISWGCSRLWVQASVSSPILAALSPSGAVWKLGWLEWKGFLFAGCWPAAAHLSQANEQGLGFLEQPCSRWEFWACIHTPHCTSQLSFCQSRGHSICKKLEAPTCI